MQRAEQAKGARGGAEAARASAEAGRGGVKDRLRGMSGYDAQAAALAPDGAAPERRGGGRQAGADKAAAPGVPSRVAIPEGGEWLLTVTTKHSAFDQFVRASGADAPELGDAAPPVGCPVPVSAKGAWAVEIAHAKPADIAWAPEKPAGQRIPSRHTLLGQGKDSYVVGSEDFKDDDFNDLVVSVTRPTPEGAEAGAYLVKSETKVSEGVVAYDVVLGATAEGQVDVILNGVAADYEGLGALDAATLDAMVRLFAELETEVAAAPTHADNRAALMAAIGSWRAALAATPRKRGPESA